MSNVRNQTVGRAEADMRLDRWFKTHFPDLAFSRLQKLLRTGQIRVDGGRAKTSQRLEAGQVVRIPPLGEAQEPAEKGDKDWRGSLSAEDAKFVKSLVVYGDDDVLVINKPAGLAVQGGTKTERHLDGMLSALADKGGERPRLVHRLDRDTSGVMMLAKTRAAATRLGDAFKHKETRKIYWAITAGVPDPREGEISMPLGKAGGPGQERMVADPEEGKSAITWYKVIDTAGSRAALVALWPRTGRTHQLRAHMAALEAPIVGDGKYGGKEAFLTGGDFPAQVHLHAREIDIPGSGTRIAAALPEHMLQTLEMLGLDTEDLIEDPFEEWAAPKPPTRKSSSQGTNTQRSGGQRSGAKKSGARKSPAEAAGSNRSGPRKSGPAKPRPTRSSLGKAAKGKSAQAKPSRGKPKGTRGKDGGSKRR
ncbi:RluA family pseudouridine synthase [Hwanghaeella grinnelliae]|uniref:Ribosomal large subunit pseudouridine synthase D n=1 Tax=Hwanghaeella grinnelliae TaxID=2500179 RepID=A0A3S2VND9_9PROT|nr:RluA family pseudouridine synthase [Hwanghaeella grinnelliae]RVU34678.1 RluA family pseudouridine synthase [Hwanghaeella grinnelliae]